MGFRSPDATAAIVPTRLQRIWEKDNKKESLLWEMGSMGSVTGDCFVKVAYEEPWVDPSGMPHPGRVRILPLNSAFCFPEWHPHDRKRLIRFKLKYRFWGTTQEGTRQVFTYCVDDRTEILTRTGWKHYTDLRIGDECLGLDPRTEEIVWQPVKKVNVFDFRGDLVRWKGERIDALSTWNHRWLYRGRGQDQGLQFKVTAEFWNRSGDLVCAGGDPVCFSETPIYSDAFVELLGWALTDGHYAKGGHLIISQSKRANPENCERLQALVQAFSYLGTTSVYGPRENGICQFYFARPICDLLKAVAPPGGLRGGAGQPSIEWLSDLTVEQAQLLLQTMYYGEGDHGESRQTLSWGQKDPVRTDFFLALAAMLGYSVRSRYRADQDIHTITIYGKGEGSTTVQSLKQSAEWYEGKVWCPSTDTKTWLARRNGSVYWTGNTELLTENNIEEYVNDELIDARENPLGEIPIVHISNLPIASSPWGMPDIQDITILNRTYTEVATDITDIVNYHAAPVTVVIGARASNLEKGSHQTWSIPNKEAKVENLLFDPRGIEQAIKLLEVLKRAMHELTGIPVTALGEEQAISNTSGVALAIQYQPLMNRFHLKATQYGEGFAEVNRLALKTLFMKEPETLTWNDTWDPPMRDDSLPMLDPMDPVTYENTVHFQPPLPVDKLVLLNELQVKMALGLESKRGALEELGEEFPDEKLQELFKELLDDSEQQAALEVLKAQVASLIVNMTGMVSPEGPQPLPPPPAGNGKGKNGNGGVKSAGGPQVNTAPTAKIATAPGLNLKDNVDVAKMYQRIVTLAHGTTIPQRRVPEEDES